MKKLLLVLGCSIILTGCNAVAPFIVSDDDEREVGRQYHAELLKTYKIDSTSAKAQWINSVGKRLAKQQGRSGFTANDYSFYVVDSSIINAFAVPGGRIYIYNGLINKTANEDQVAGVIAHEIGHIAAGHYREQVVKLNGLSFIASLVSGKSSAADLALNVGTYLTQMKMSRNNEYQADSLSVAYLAKDGQLSPWGMKSFLDTLNKMDSNSISFEILTTHPRSQKRADSVAVIIKNAYPTQAKIEENHPKPY